MSQHRNSNKELLAYYLQNVEGLRIDDDQEIDQSDQALSAFQSLFEKLQLLQGEYSKLEKTKRAALPSPPSEIPQSIRKMLKLQTSVITLQSWWRKVLTLKRLERDARLSKSAFNARKAHQTPEEAAMKEFTQQLKTKKLTPESFFRICDTEYKQSVTVASFKDQLTALNIQLTRAQMSRLIIILDEDIEGNITLQEYNNALEAYGVSAERHKPLDGSALFHPFEHKCLFKLIQELNKMQISYIEMFNACDVNDDTRVNINEIRNFVEGLSPDFKQKEIHALMNFIDIDKNGLIDKDEFLRQLTRGEQTMRQTLSLNKQIAEQRTIQRAQNNFMTPTPTFQNTFQRGSQEDTFMRFEEEEMGGGDQAFMPETEPVQTKSPPKQSYMAMMQSKQTASLNADQIRRKQIIERMEREGLSFQLFFDNIKKQTTNGLVTLGAVLQSMETSYKSISPVDRNFLVKDCIRERTKIDYVLLEELFVTFSKNMLPSVTQTFQAIASNILQKMSTTPKESLSQFFRAQGLSESDIMSDMEFQQIFGRIVPSITPSTLSQAFNSLNVDSDGFTNVRDISDVLMSYMSVQSRVPILSSNELQKIIPGIDTMSPRTRCENVIKYVTKELNNKCIRLISVYRMADTANTGSIQASLLEAAFKKMLPQLKPEVIKEVLQAFRVKSPTDIVTRSDYETVFPEIQLAKSSQGFAQSTGSMKPNTVIKTEPVNEEEHVKWIKKLDNAMLREGISPSVAFKSADTNHNGIITTDELKESIKRLIPEETLSYIELGKIIKAFDTNRNGTIDEQEFISQFEKARSTTITVIEQSPQKSQPIVDNRKSTLPLKENIGSKPIQPTVSTDQNNLTLMVNTIDDKFSLKKMFNELPINEEGRILVTHLTRRLKEAKANDGSTLKPTDYMIIVNALDSQNTGVIDVKDAIIFFDRHLKSNALDCLLEVKYMANFIEFKVKNRNSKSFFETNSKLKSGQRLIEVEVMSELNKIFGISLSVGNTIYNQLAKAKGIQNVMLDDLCNLIDEQRIVKIESTQAVTKTAKLDPYKILLQLKTKINELPKRIQTEISQKLNDVDKKEKQVPYSEFFVEFVEENQFLTSDESKVLYQHLKSKYPPNVTHQCLQMLGVLIQLEAPIQPKEEQKVPQKPQAQPTQVQEPSSAVDVKLLVKAIEDSIKTSLEEALEDFLKDEAVPVIQLHRKLQNLSPTVDKRQLTILTQQMSKAGTGKVTSKEIVMFLKSIPGKYNQQEIINEITADLDQPYIKTLADYGLVGSEAYSKEDFIDVLSFAPMSRFRILSLFYSLSEGQDELFGQSLLSKLKDDQNASQGSIKKIVTFSEPVKDDALIKILLQNFVDTFPQISQDAVIQSAVNKFSQQLKSYKSISDSISQFDSSGRGQIHVDWFKLRLDDNLKQPLLSEEEKLVITFIPLDKFSPEITLIDIIAYFKYLVSLQPNDKTVLAHNKTKLQQNLELIKKILAPNKPTYQPKPKQQQPPVEEEKKITQTKNEPGLQKQNTSFTKRQSAVAEQVRIISIHVKDPKKKESFIALFNQATNGALQPDVVYHHMSVNWGVELTDEQQEQLEREVDLNNTGRFRLNDFIRFCERFNIDLGMGLLKGTTFNQNFGKNLLGGNIMKCETLEYPFNPAIDHYKGIPTILTSEEAALVVCESLYRSIPEDKEFFDQDFGPKNAQDMENGKKALYFTGVQPPGYPDPELIEWTRPEDFCSEEPKFLIDGASANDVKQGKIGDCWLISALSVLATRDELLRGGIGKIKVTADFRADRETALLFSKGVYPPMFHIYRKKGLYVFRFFKNYKWVYVIIDDRIPCQGGKPVFGTCKNPNEMWVPLIEKAYAKLHGCYEALISGYIDDALTDLTGFVAEKYNLHNAQGVFPHASVKDKEEFWQFIRKRIEEGCLMGCSKSNKGEQEIIVDGFRTGILAGHAYGLMDAFELADPDMQNPNPLRRSHRILRIRNPWGWKEWNGKWGDKSDEVEIHADKITQYVNSIEDEDEKYSPGDEDGTFLMNYQNFRNIFNSMYICVDFPEQWSGIRYESEWTQETTGGIPQPINEETRARWAKNPQFCIQNNKYDDLELFISLGQPDGRGQYFGGNAIKFPYAEVIHQVCFAVMQLPPGQKQITRFDEKLIKAMSIRKEHKEVSLRIKVGKGSYVIVPTTTNHGELGKFFVSIYFNKPKGGLHFSRLDQPQNNDYKPIMEESENSLMVPEWKVDLCQKRIKTMILEQDQSMDKTQSNLSNTSKVFRLSEAMEKATVKKNKKPGQNSLEVTEEEAFQTKDEEMY